MVVVLWRTMVIEVAAAVEVPEGGWSPSRHAPAATLRRPSAVLTLPTPVFLAVALEGFAMAYMLVAH